MNDRVSNPVIPMDLCRKARRSLDDLPALIREAKLEARRNAEKQVAALLAAGWHYELPDIDDSEPWQWYWRRPPRRKGSKGMFFWSTQQAYNSLMRQTP